jgi:hypothetical protein
MPKRLAALAAAVAAVLFWSAPAMADIPGFGARMTQAPTSYTIGGQARTLGAVVTTSRDGPRCQRVRWALVISTDGVSLDQIRISRVENGRTVPVRAQIGADTARVVDSQPDQGRLCRDSNVTAQWLISFTGPDNGRATFEARAFNQGGLLLATAGVTSRVVTPVAAKQNKPSASASASPSPTSTFSAQPTKAVTAVIDAPSSAPAYAAAASQGPSLLLPGLIVGAVLVFLGVALLLWLRRRGRRSPVWAEDTQMLPTGFYYRPRQ